MDYRGYVAPKTTGRLTTDYFFAGQRTSPITRVITGEKTIQNVTPLRPWQTFGQNVVIVSTCGLHAAMAASGKGDATVDSVDVAHAGLVYYLKYRALSCQSFNLAVPTFQFSCK